MDGRMITSRQAHALGFYRAPDGRLYVDWRFIDPMLRLGVHR